MWQSYVDDELLCTIGGKRLTSAAIVGKDGAVWAKSSNFPAITPSEISAIKNSFVPSRTLANGIYIGGMNYNQIINTNPDVFHGKKGRGGFTIKKTKQTLIIGIYDEQVIAGHCSMVVGKLGDYLVENGY